MYFIGCPRIPKRNLSGAVRVGSFPFLNETADLLEFVGAGDFAPFKQGRFERDDRGAAVGHAAECEFPVPFASAGDGIGRDEDLLPRR